MDKVRHKPSPVAVFMYCVIVVSALIAVISFIIYYNRIYYNDVILWIGVTFFMIMYHLWIRIIFGNITKLISVNHNQWWFREKNFEKRVYKILRVKKWKNKALTYNPEMFSVKNRSLSDIVNTTVKSEFDHWINVALSLSTVFFALIWGELWIFLLTGTLAALFDSQFIIIQRYNRPRIIKLIKKSELLNKNNNNLKKRR